MRVGIIALLHESNTFIRAATTCADFEAGWLLRGDELLCLAASQHEVGGFFAGLDRAELAAVPVFAARALPYGTITGEATDRLLTSLFEELERAGPLDGLLVAPHGATVSETQPDFDGHWLEELRQRAGPGTPIVSTLDLHANLSPRMVRACDATIGYATNPHLDQKERGLEAAALLARGLRGEVRPTQAAAFPPLAINIERQRTAAPPCATILEEAGRLRSRPEVLSTSVVLGFPYADVAEMGSSVIVVTDDDPSGAGELAGSLAESLWARRHEFLGELVDVEEALDQVADRRGPICLLDMGDNVGGGSPGDGTHLAWAIHRRGLPGAFVCIFDPEVVRQVDGTPAGGRLSLRIGGKTDDLHGPPLDAEFTLVSLHEGRFVETETRHGGFAAMDQGRTAVLRTERGLTVMVTSRRVPPFSLVQLTSCGLDPAAFSLLVAKGVHAPVAAYEPVCRELVRVNTPGVTCADMTRLEYQHRRRPMLPFERDTDRSTSP